MSLRITRGRGDPAADDEIVTLSQEVAAATGTGSPEPSARRSLREGKGMRRPFAFCIALLVLLSGSVAVAAAQDAGPAASPAALPETPDPALCRGEPRPRAYFEQFVGTPAPDAGFGRVAAVAELPPGGPADAATAAAIAATLREAFACFNAGDPPRAFAHSTERFARQRFAAGLTPEDAAAFAVSGPPLPPEERATIVAIREMRVLVDGRVGMLFDLEVAGQPRTYFEIFLRQDDRWLVDERIIVEPAAATPAAATPAA